MYKGTTPIIEVDLNLDTSLIEVAYATFEQNNTQVFEKTLTDGITLKNDIASVKLSQADTNQLTVGVPLLMQMKIKLEDGTVFATDPVTFKVCRSFKEGEI